MKQESQEERLHVTIAIVIGIFLVLGFILTVGGKQTPGAPRDMDPYQNPADSGNSPAQNAAAMDEQIAPRVHIANDPERGYYLTDTQGRALYTTTKESCTGECLAKWPPYLVEPQNLGLAGRLTTVARADTGDVQFAWNGKLLYYYANDQEAAITGDGVGGVWTVAKP